MAKSTPKGKGDERAEKIAHGNVRMGEIQTAAASTMEPADYQGGYPAPEKPLRNAAYVTKKGRG